MNIVKKTLSDQIYDVLRAEIIKQNIPLGSKIVNRELQQQFGVSSSPIRDAINKLYQDGLISSIDQTGAQVIDIDYEFFLEVNEILLYIVNTGIKLAYEKNEDLSKIYDKLCDLIEKQKAAIGTETYYNVDYDFHKLLISYSYNSRLIKLFKQYNSLHEILVRYSSKIIDVEEQREKVNDHEKIAGAFVQGNIDAALEYNEDHYKKAEIIFRRVLLSRNKTNEQISE